MNKIKGYREQDNNRIINDNNYVDVKWLSNCINKLCSNCNELLYANVEGGKVDSNITADRIDNLMGHSKDNIRGCCKYCNSYLSNKPRI